MKRTVITMDGNGEFSIPSNLQDLWMIEGELVDMLHVTAPKLHAVIRSMYKRKACFWCRMSNRKRKLPRAFGKRSMASR